VSFNEAQRPYPFAAWPAGEVAPRRKTPARKKKAVAKPADKPAPESEPPAQA
jgi:hypothetical protein